jgi:hypothetical protein
MIRGRLSDRGAYLPPVAPRLPAGPVQHPHYEAYRTMLRWGLAVGGYGNDPALDAEVTPAGFIYLLANVGQRALADVATGPRLIQRFGLPTGSLAPADAAAIVGAFVRAAGIVAVAEAATWSDLVGLGFPLPEPTRSLRRGEIYALASWVLDLAGRRYPPTSAGSLSAAAGGVPVATLEVATPAR